MTDIANFSVDGNIEATQPVQYDYLNMVASQELVSKLVIKESIKLFLTFGLYRFWMKTNLRQMFWQSARIKGEPLEYTGTAIELLIGTMIAVIILSVWLVLINMGLSFMSLAYWQKKDPSVLLSLLLILPIIQFARYRARRYRLLRTKWRGIRMGMDGSALKYVGVWAKWWVGTMLTLGFLHPWKQVALEKYMTNHMLYGDHRFTFKGAGKDLIGFWLLPWIVFLLFGLGPILYFGYTANYDTFELFFIMKGVLEEQAANSGTELWVLILMILFLVFSLGFITAYIPYLRYRAREIGYMITSRNIAEVKVVCELRLIHLFGPAMTTFGYSIGYGILLTVGLVIINFILLSIILVVTGEDASQFSTELWFDTFSTTFGKFGFMVYLWINYGVSIIFTIWLGTVIYFRRVLMHTMQQTKIQNLDSLNTVKQRTKDDQLESEGFADALDVGGL